MTECNIEPLVAVTWTLYTIGGVFLEAETIRTEDAVPPDGSAIDDGLTVAKSPLFLRGETVVVRLTVPTKVPGLVRVIDDEPAEPLAIESDVGVAVIAKSVEDMTLNETST